MPMIRIYDNSRQFNKLKEFLTARQLNILLRLRANKLLPREFNEEPKSSIYVLMTALGKVFPITDFPVKKSNEQIHKGPLNQVFLNKGWNVLLAEMLRDCMRQDINEQALFEVYTNILSNIDTNNIEATLPKALKAAKEYNAYANPVIKNDGKQEMNPPDSTKLVVAALSQSPKVAQKQEQTQEQTQEQKQVVSIQPIVPVPNLVEELENAVSKTVSLSPKLASNNESGRNSVHLASEIFDAETVEKPVTSRPSSRN